MKELVKKSLIPASSAIAGGLMVIGAVHFSPRFSALVVKPAQPSPRVVSFNRPFLQPVDPFTELENIEKQMQNDFKMFDFNHDVLVKSSSMESGPKVSEREDNDFIYYDVDVNDPASTKINTKVEGGFLSIKGTEEKKDPQTHSVFRSEFNESFSLPEYADAKRIQLVSEKDKLIIKIPKLKTASKVNLEESGETI